LKALRLARARQILPPGQFGRPAGALR